MALFSAGVSTPAFAQVGLEDLLSKPVGRIHFNSLTPKAYYFLLKRTADVQKTVVGGTLLFPDNITGPVPAMVISHGSGGVMSNITERWTPLLLKMGIAVFVVDSFGARGIADTVSNQSQLSFAVDIADAFSALKLLATDPRIDPQRIGNIGFSRGGSVAVNTLVERLRKSVIPKGDTKFAAHVAFYPACDYAFSGDSSAFTNTPILFELGEKDDYVSTALCVNYAQKLKAVLPKVVINVYEGAYHDFDALLYGRTWLANAVSNIKCSGVSVDPDTLKVVDLATNITYPGWDEYLKEVKSCMSRGGTIEGNAQVAKESEANVQAFLTLAFGLIR